jgi:hypothetical protein
LPATTNASCWPARAARPSDQFAFEQTKTAQRLAAAATLEPTPGFFWPPANDQEYNGNRRPRRLAPPPV